jgi:hypothetical protein
MNEEHVLGTIELLQAQVRDMEQELAETKRTVNTLCKRIRRDPIYPDTEPSHGNSPRTDEFYGKPLASVVRTILERRQAAGMGAASIEAIFAIMKKGGYLFDAKNEGNAKRSLSISLAKNTTTFHRLPNGDFGILEWYPNIPQKARANGGDKEEKTATVDEDGPYHNEFAEEAEKTEQAKVDKASAGPKKKALAEILASKVRSAESVEETSESPEENGLATSEKK